MAPAHWRLLAGKTAAITGGTTGIGRAIALEYLRQGCNVAINHLGLPRDATHLTSIVEEAKALKSAVLPAGTLNSPVGDLLEITGDVTNPETGRLLVEQAVEKWGKLDIFVSNAGIFTPADFLSLDHDLFASTMRVNYDGAFYSCQAAARQMVSQGHGGSIIGISSISALVGGQFQTHYTPTKAAVLSLMQSMAIALGPHNIRCNALLPGTIRTQLSEEELKTDKKAYLEARIPLGRVGDPEDMAGPATFLACGELSGYVNGAQLLADGGMFVNLQ